MDSEKRTLQNALLTMGRIRAVSLIEHMDLAGCQTRLQGATETINLSTFHSSTVNLHCLVWVYSDEY